MSIWDKYAGYGNVETTEREAWKKREESTTVTQLKGQETLFYTTGNGTPLNGTRDGMKFENGYKVDSAAAAAPSWIDGTSTPGQATVNRRAPIVPIPSAILVKEDDASLDTKRPLGSGTSNRPVVDRTTGRIRTEEEEENRLRGAVLLR